MQESPVKPEDLIAICKQEQTQEAVEFLIKSFPPNKMAGLCLFGIQAYLALVNSILENTGGSIRFTEDMRKMFHLAKYVMAITGDHLKSETLDG